MDSKLEYLLSLCTRTPGGRIVNSKDLNEHQIAEAQMKEHFFVDEHGCGFAFLPWTLSTTTDRKREADYFARNNMMV